MTDRYHRQALFAPIGGEGQRLLQSKKVAIIGLGALGASLAQMAARAGIGHLVLVDRDVVELTNLQRQILYTEEDVKEQLPKAVAAQEHLKAINSEITIEAHVSDLNAENADDLLQDCDLILDGTDNFATRYLINDVAVKHHIPWIYGAAVRSQGAVATIISGVTPCFQCLFPQAPVASIDTCDTAGVISPIIQIVTAYQMTEAMKILTGHVETIRSQLLHVDPWYGLHYQMDTTKQKKVDCPCCGKHHFHFLDNRMNQPITSVLCGRDTVQIRVPHRQQLNFTQLEERLQESGSIHRTPHFLQFKPTEYAGLTLTVFQDGRVLLHGITDPDEALSLYRKLIGL